MWYSVLVQEPRPAPLADRLFLASILSIFVTYNEGSSISLLVSE